MLPPFILIHKGEAERATIVAFDGFCKVSDRFICDNFATHRDTYLYTYYSFYVPRRNSRGSPACTCHTLRNCFSYHIRLKQSRFPLRANAIIRVTISTYKYSLNKCKLKYEISTTCLHASHFVSMGQLRQ